jgi:hypothetical protein
LQIPISRNGDVRLHSVKEIASTFSRIGFRDGEDFCIIAVPLYINNPKSCPSIPLPAYGGSLHYRS